MCVDLFDVYILPWVVGESCRYDGVEKGGGETKGTVGREDGESLNVEVVRLLLGWWWLGG